MSKNGLILLTPTSVTRSGGSATIVGNGSVTFASVTSLSLNGVFSSDYNNYMVVFRWRNGLGENDINMRLRSSGSDNTTAFSYTKQNITGDGGSIYGRRDINLDRWDRLTLVGNDRNSGSITYFYSPYKSQHTAVRMVNVDGYQGAFLDDGCGTHNQTSSYDGFTFYVTSGSLTGRVAVYGMRN